ncbi:PQQ-dependent sugar dehydrogenase [Algoriphagus sediminis]|uniref:PQQ-dependent sugar dehydrogenase n=1 Tax=Algoriphagus sediminis TaxID=3057113 RepID=A0ABT7Y8W5_9BACT|nr:PQQ-dependent sugar dehydrogenase [Algoriphagus sediminis]MDN3202951.1 PQQ-dependent sugar dehydrogenase [Algoriphagus sediminis]
MKIISWSGLRNKDFGSTKMLLLGALFFTLSCQPTDNGEKPEDNRFTVSVLTEPDALDEPMAFTFLNNQEMLIVERKGGVKHLNVETNALEEVGNLAVNIIYTNKEGQSRPAEEGLIGVTAHPDFATNNWVYLMYAHPDEPKHVVSRFEFKNGFLYPDSEIIMLEYPVQREECCHTGGGMVWEDQGNLFITTGNNTVNPPTGTSNLDERPGMENRDDQRTAGNTNDLRGKILRIHPEDDGSYSIPEGNLFPVGTEGTRPEIYTMGHRNPWRVSWDSETGYIYWGEVGPDASEDSERGPRGYDEFNQAKGPGFFGWPYFIGDNFAYVDYDHVNEVLGEPFDPMNVVNTSVNNTGLEKLPEPQPAMLYYPYANSEEFPLMGSAGRSATGGPVFRKADFPESDKRFPSYYEGKWLIVEFMRGWIVAITMDENGDYVSMEPFLPNEKFISAIDMSFSPDGDLYVLEYGSAWFQGNDNALVKRVRFNGGNREPVVVAISDKKAGAVPFNVQLSSEGTLDYDGDDLDYSWNIKSDNGYNETISGANPSITLTEPGRYTATLSVTDEAENTNQITLDLFAGNEPPVVDIDISRGNTSFFFADSEIEYSIKVSDKEDGSTADGSIPKEEVAVNFDYAPEGFDIIEVSQNRVVSDEWIEFSRGKTLIAESDCYSCHKIDEGSIGPSYSQVANRYENDSEGQSMLAAKIVNGGVGVWGEHAMSAHPDISMEDAQQMVDYIMGINDQLMQPEEMELSGAYTTRVPASQNGNGGYILRAAYQDKGAAGLPGLSSEKIIALRNPVLLPENAEMESGTEFLTTPREAYYLNVHDGYVGYRQLDLDGIEKVTIIAEAPERYAGVGGVIEVHLDSPDGPLVGATEKIGVSNIDLRAETQRLVEEWEANGSKGPIPNFRTVRELLRPSFDVEITGVEGVHDVYFVGKNPEAQPSQKLLQINEFRFIQKK